MISQIRGPMARSWRAPESAREEKGGSVATTEPSKRIPVLLSQQGGLEVKLFAGRSFLNSDLVFREFLDAIGAENPLL